MQSSSKPEPPKSAFNVEVIASAAVVGYLFSMFIFIGFLALFKLPLSLPGDPEYWGILLAVLTAGTYLIAIPLDKRKKITWFRFLLIALCVSFISSLLVFFDIYLVGVLLSAVIIIPAVLCSIMCVSYPGYYTETRIRGKVVSLTVIFVFGFVAMASLASILLPALGLKAGFLVYGLSALILIPLSFKLMKSPTMQYIARPGGDSPAMLFKNAFCPVEIAFRCPGMVNLVPREVDLARGFVLVRAPPVDVELDV